MKNTLWAGIFAIAGVTPGFAADAVYADPIMEAPAIFNWSGAYIGLQAGYGWGDADNDFPIAALEIDGEIDGGFAGLYGGWNWQTGSFVVGIDADINYSDIGGTAVNDLGGDELDTTLDWTAALRGRLGYAWGGVLIYGAAGAAFADVEIDVSDSFGDTFASADDTLTGWTVGAGIEAAFTENVVGRFDYRYTEYGEIDYSPGASDGSVDIDLHSVAVGIAYKF